MSLTRFDAPGFLTDLDEIGLNAWSEFISDALDKARERSNPRLINYGPRQQFFNALKNPSDEDAVEKDVTWTAFPRIVKLQSISDVHRWRIADSSRDKQDEYCEWSVTRDPDTDKITRITFTSESPEYWQFLASVAPDKVLARYQEHISPGVRREDLFRGGQYIPRNKWNNSTTTGAMHLIQNNNTLLAEIELAAAATLTRRQSGSVLTDAQALIRCGAYGQPERHSDPHIGEVVNELAREKADVTLANPVGLCIAGISVAGWQTPDNSNPLDYWKIVRGTPEKALRAVFEVPASKNFVVGDIKISGREIQFGAQLADFITIKLTGLATRFGKSTMPPLDGCVGRKPDLAGAAIQPAVRVQDSLSEHGFTTFR
jgi:hypothetical protein